MKMGVISKIGIYYNKHPIFGMMVVTKGGMSATYNRVGWH